MVFIRTICVILLIRDSDNYRPVGAMLVHFCWVSRFPFNPTYVLLVVMRKEKRNADLRSLRMMFACRSGVGQVREDLVTGDARPTGGGVLIHIAFLWSAVVGEMVLL